MNTGQTVLAQLMEFIPTYKFQLCVDRNPSQSPRTEDPARIAGYGDHLGTRRLCGAGDGRGGVWRSYRDLSLGPLNERSLHRSNLDHAADSAVRCPRERLRQFGVLSIPSWDKR